MNVAQSMIPVLDQLASQGANEVSRLIKAAYEMGREDMRSELMALLSPSRESGNFERSDQVIVEGTVAKARPGTVRPAILDLINHANGLQTEQIIRTTGFKQNSVRGTISTLAKEGKIERRENGWVKKIGAPAQAEAPKNLRRLMPSSDKRFATASNPSRRANEGQVGHVNITVDKPALRGSQPRGAVTTCLVGMVCRLRQGIQRVKSRRSAEKRAN